jgi:DNA-binding MarR family transcriptional regulator
MKKVKVWKSQDAEVRVLKRLLQGEATKYRIKEDLRIPLPTLLNVIRRLELDGLVEHRMGKKRRSHVCRLTSKGLICFLKGKRPLSSLSFEELELAKQTLLRLLKEEGLTRDEIVQGLSRPERGVIISDKALSCYMKQYLRFLVAKSFVSYPSISEIVEEFRRENSGFSWYNLRKNFGGVIGWTIKDNVSRTGEAGEAVVFPASHQISNCFFGCYEDEAKELTEFIAKRDDHMRTILFDWTENSLSALAGKPWRIRRWLIIGCAHLCLEFNIKDIQQLLELLRKESRNIKTKVNLNRILDFKIIEIIGSARCPMDKNKCEKREWKNIVNCKKFLEATLLQKGLRDAMLNNHP